MNEWLRESPDSSGTKEFELGGAMFKIRRLNGLEQNEVQAAGRLATFVLLKYGLIDQNADDEAGYDPVVLREFCEKRPVAARHIANAIDEFTGEAISAEEKMLEVAEKNSKETGRKQPEESGADITGKTR